LAEALEGELAWNQKAVQVRSGSVKEAGQHSGTAEGKSGFDAVYQE